MRDLITGAFYWVLPVFDVDFTPSGAAEGDDDFDARYSHWTQSEQPARFDGYDAHGNERWFYIGVDQDADPWPVRWVGRVIKPTAELGVGE